jgi:antitoxin VapB
MPALNIKNEATYRLADELARRTGETLTEAVTIAVRERLERIRRPDGGRLAERLLAIGRDCAAHLEEPLKSMDIDELLYDENGLFK